MAHMAQESTRAGASGPVGPRHGSGPSPRALVCEGKERLRDTGRITLETGCTAVRARRYARASSTAADAARAERVAWGDYMQERAYTQALEQIDGIEYHVAACVGAAYNANLLVRDMQRGAGPEPSRAKVNWADPLQGVLHRLRWVHDRLKPKDTSSRTEMGAELGRAIAQLCAATRVGGWSVRGEGPAPHAASEQEATR